MHVSKIVSRRGEREYVSWLVRRSFREGGKVRHETLANLSALPQPAIEAVRASLAGKTLVTAGQDLRIVRGLPHGHVAAVWAQAKALGLPALLGPAGRMRDLALALIVSRVVAPAPKRATLSWWADTTLGVDLGVADADTDEVYAAMDWLVGRQDQIEAKLAARHLAADANPSRMALFDLSSSWVEGTTCPLAARGYSRDGRKGKAQIEYGLLCDAVGRPVAVRVFAGNTADPAAFIEAVTVVKDRFGLTDLVMVGDCGMITNARIDALREHTQLGWLTCLRAPAIKILAADDGPLQMSLFDTQDLAEIVHPDYPGERLICCRNPALAAERARKREDLLAATETLLAAVKTRVEAGGLSGQDAIGVAVGKIVNKYKMAKHFTLHIDAQSLSYQRDQARIDAEAALDGIYVIRTSVPTDTLDAAATVFAYKQLSHVERDLRHIKTDDLALRPIHHRLEDRVRAHVLICMLAAYLVWHLRATLAPLTYTDTAPPARDNPVAPARRSDTAARKASRHRDDDNEPVRSFRTLLTHLGTLTRNRIHITTSGANTDTAFDQLTEPTPAQRRAFELLGTPIPITLT
ncbi:MAG TPA: IS1634 family transposase [Candidatus Limnocylindrales bacterium]|nr:IS1634 family transposase [Candidatus Limnocylindrales bacterium]